VTTPGADGGIRAAAPPLRIAFIRMGPHPIPNRLLPPELAASLPGGAVEIFDLEAAVRQGRLAMAINLLFVVLEHGWNLLRGRIRLWNAFFTTPFMFRHMSRLARRFIAAGDFDVSLQSQSTYDARVPGTPNFIYTDHTHLANLEYPDYDRRCLRGPRWLALERALYDGATGVFTRSQNISRNLEEVYGQAPERIVCVGAGSNAQLPDSLDERAREGSHDILFVGVDWERKGGPELVEAFVRIADERPEARLVIVGCEPAALHPQVRVVGRCPVEEVHRHYETAAIFCLPTRREPFGVVFVEALHYGLPIVATRIGAVPDMVEHGENGYLVEVGDVDALADHLAELLDDEALRHRMGERALRHGRENYSWQVVARRMIDTIENSLKIEEKNETNSNIRTDTGAKKRGREDGTDESKGSPDRARRSGQGSVARGMRQGAAAQSRAPA